MPRTCFIILEGQRDEAGYIPSVVTEGEYGHDPLTGKGECAQPWHWGKTYEEAQETCVKENARLGLGVSDVIAITLSSMRRG